jgi:hypothetical protein
VGTLRVGINDADEFGLGHSGKHAGMVAAERADTDNCNWDWSHV